MCKRSKFFLLICCLAVCTSKVSAQSYIKDSLEFGNGAYVSPEYILQGKVSGVRVSQTDGNIAGIISTNIRGLNSSYLASNPLWIIDGVPLSDCSYQIQDAFDKNFYGSYNYMSKLSQLDFLNLYDIDNIKVLKNLSEVATFGSRGANGVVIIETKQCLSDKLLISLNTNYGLALNNSFCNSHNFSVGFNRSNTSFRASAFYRDIKGGFKGAGADRFGGFRVRMDMRSNTIFWAGFEGNIAIGKQSLQSAAAKYGVPTMGLALQGIEIPGKINTIDAWVNGYDNYANVFRTNGDIYLQVNFLPNFHWKTDINFDVNSSGRYFWYDLDTEFGKQQNRAAAINSATVVGYCANTDLNYSRYFGTHHKIVLNINGSIFGEINKFNNMSGDHFLTSALREKGFSLRESASKPHSTEKNYYTWSANTGIDYSYSNIVGVNARVLVDKINRYDNKAEIYPSANLWFDLRNAFFSGCTEVSSLKLNGGWGKAGLRRFIPFQLAVVSLEQSRINDALAAANIELSPTEPEKILYNYFDCYNRIISSEWNVGLGISFLKERIKLQLSYYSKNTNENFNVFGFGQKKFEDSPIWKKCDPWTLMDDTKSYFNRGIEADISANIISRKNICWDINMNVTAARSDMRFLLNESIPDFNPVPKVHGGLGTTLKCYGALLEVDFTGAAGHEIYNMNRMLSDGVADIEAKYIEKGDWLRLSKIGIGYDIPIDNVKWIRNLRVTITGTNLLTATGYSGQNPDVNCFGVDNNFFSGIDYGALPLHRQLLLGLKAEF